MNVNFFTYAHCHSYFYHWKCISIAWFHPKKLVYRGFSEYICCECMWFLVFNKKVHPLAPLVWIQDVIQESWIPNTIFLTICCETPSVMLLLMFPHQSSCSWSQETTQHALNAWWQDLIRVSNSNQQNFGYIL